MVDRHVHSIAGVPLNAGQDQKAVVLPQMPDLPVIGDGDKVISGLPVYTDRLNTNFLCFPVFSYIHHTLYLFKHSMLPVI